MSDTPTMDVHAAPSEERCAQCSKLLTPDDRVEAGGKVFCRSCYAELRTQLEAVVESMSSGIHYPNAMLGAVLGGAAGALVWWGFTAIAKVSLGLIAIGIGFSVGWSTVRFAGGKRSGGLQAISVIVAALSYLVATYLVNMTFINRSLAGQGNAFRVGFPPQSLAMAWQVLHAGFDVMDVVFLAIVVYEAWKIPRPIVFPAPRHS
jgi:hypothetical protein